MKERITIPGRAPEEDGYLDIEYRRGATHWRFRSTQNYSSQTTLDRGETSKLDGWLNRNVQRPDGVPVSQHLFEIFSPEGHWKVSLCADYTPQGSDRREWGITVCDEESAEFYFCDIGEEGQKKLAAWLAPLLHPEMNAAETGVLHPVFGL